MKFAAGLTVTGILSFLLLEALKLVMVPVTAWVIGFLALLIKIILIGLGLVVAASVIGLAVFVYKRYERGRAEA